MTYDTKIKSFQGKEPAFYAERRLNDRCEEIVDAVKDLEGVELEIREYYLCVSGETMPHRETLKSLKFRWDRFNKLWYKAMTFTSL